MSGERWHGTVGGYTNHSCRCDKCRNTWAAYCRKRKAERSLTDPFDPRHGTENGYGNYNCRCRRCTDAHTAGTTARARRRGARQRAMLDA